MGKLLAWGAALALLLACGGGAPPGGPPHEVTTAEVTALYEDRRFGLAELRTLRGRLAARDFAALERALDALQQRWERDHRQELDLWGATSKLAADPGLLPHLDAWVAERPASYAAYLLRGAHRLDRGAAARGPRVAGQTSREQFAQMREQLDRAKRDLAAALERNPRAIVAFACLIRIARIDGDRELRDRSLEAALALDPASYRVRREYLIAMQPRWGESWPKMTRFAADAQRHAARNPLLLQLAGAAQHDMARELHRRKQHREAIDGFSGALQWGPYPPSLVRRAEVWLALDREREAFADLDRALALDPFRVDGYRYRARLRAQRGELDAALADLDSAGFIDGFDALVLQDRGWLQERRGDARAARRAYSEALARDPGNGWVRARLAALEAR